MTPIELKEARQKLGLTLSQCANLLGYNGNHANQQVRRMESGERPILEAQTRLMKAYLEGYRPADWPE